MYKRQFTHYEKLGGNSVETNFYGRLHLQHAFSTLYFHKSSVVQSLIHNLKYRNDQEAGVALGRIMGLQMKESTRFDQVDYLLPMPLHPKKERLRGYNQAAVLCRGIEQITGIQSLIGILI